MLNPMPINGVTSRICSKCGRLLPFTAEYFHRTNSTKSGLRGTCKECAAEYMERWRVANRERKNALNRKYAQTHKEQIAEYAPGWYLQNKEAAQRTHRAWYEAHKDKDLAMGRAWRQSHAAEHYASVAERLRQNPQLRIRNVIARQVLRAIHDQKAGRSWERLVGYSLRGLTNHLESLFEPGMTWANYGQWHMHHIRPVVSFAFASADDPQFKECWALDNLKPLWAHENCRLGGQWQAGGVIPNA